MILEELVGTRLAVGISGTEATPELIAHLRRIRAQSLVVFERNFASPEQFTTLIERLEASLERRLLVMVDHEGGRVVRFRSGVTPFPDSLTAGRASDAEAIERQGAVEAEELKRLRVQVNLAPCVDVLVEGSDPVIGDRSYGSDPATVSALAVARIRGLQRHGVAACAKHFPGLGAVARDPHKVLPTITLPRETLQAVHLAPFRAAIQAGVAMVMSSHVCYPTLGDPAGVPATFSPRLIRRLLRHELAFSGLIATDDLMMGALRAFGTTGQAAVLASQAGHDFLLVCSDVAAQEETFNILCKYYLNNKLERRELEESTARILALRGRILAALP